MTDVFYFTGTGNSLSVARDIREHLEGNLKSIAAEEKKETVQSKAALIVIVFPVYNHIFPFIVKRFVDKFQNLQDKRILAICTYGDSPASAVHFWIQGSIPAPLRAKLAEKSGLKVSLFVLTETVLESL